MMTPLTPINVLTPLFDRLRRPGTMHSRLLTGDLLLYYLLSTQGPPVDAAPIFCDL